MDHTSHSLAQKGFRCFDPSSRFRRPGMLPSLFGVPAIVVSPLGLPFASLVRLVHRPSKSSLESFFLVSYRASSR